MTQGAGAGPSQVDTLVPACPTGHRHRFRLADVGAADGAVEGLALRCPDCADRSAAEQLTEIVAARRRTLVGLAELPPRTRADLAASGTLDEIYRGTVTDVREAAGRCREQTGVEPPTCLLVEPPAGQRDDRTAGPVFDRARATAVLDAATDWLARLPR